jgi:hypothetical protein
MQGIIFNALEEFVLETADMETWNAVLDASDLKSGGAYTSGVSYDDEEIVSLATNLCEKLGVPLTDGLRLFGNFLFNYLVTKGPIELQEYKNTQALLTNLEDVVHRDVKRIHPDAYTPFFEYFPENESQGLLTYVSKRKLCFVAEGLLAGAAENYGQKVEMDHTQCMHNGADDCRWNVKFH